MKKGKAPRFIVVKAQTTHDTKLFKNIPVTIRWVLLDDGVVFSQNTLTLHGIKHRYSWQYRGHDGAWFPPKNIKLRVPKLWKEL